MIHIEILEFKWHVCSELSDSSEKEGKKERKGETREKREIKEIHGRREEKREKINVPHLVTLFEGYMGIHFTILTIF